LAYIVKEAFDKWIPQADSRSLVWGGFGLLGLRLLSSGLAILTRLINVRTTEGMTVQVREMLTERLFRVSRRESDATKSGCIHDLVVTESQRFHMMTNSVVGRVVPSVIKATALTVVLAYLSWRLLAIMVFVWPVMWVCNEAVRRYLVKKVRASHKSFREFSSVLLNRVRLLDLIKFEHQEKNERAVIQAHVKQTSETAAPVAIMDTVYLEVQGVVLTVISIAVLTAGGEQVSSGRITVGDLISFYMVVNLLNGALREFAAGLYQVLIGYESWSRIVAWLGDEDLDVYSGTERIELEAELSVQDVHFSYREGLPLLENLSFNVKRGETVVLLGPNGCGKSTVLWLLLGLYKPQSGQICADGVNYNSLDIGWLRSQIGMVPQGAMLLDASVRENVAYGTSGVSDEEIEQALNLAGSKDWLERMPQGLDTEIGNEGTLLSGGQKQRVSLARALLKRPAFLFFDEPTNHLDENSVCKFLTTIQSLEDSPGVLIITHDNALRHIADKVYEMKGGRLVGVEPGEPKEVVGR